MGLSTRIIQRPSNDQIPLVWLYKRLYSEHEQDDLNGCPRIARDWLLEALQREPGSQGRPDIAGRTGRPASGTPP
jgi:hypothetical protein